MRADFARDPHTNTTSFPQPLVTGPVYPARRPGRQNVTPEEHLAPAT